MARVALEIPKVGLVMENARLVRWLKQVGDAVKQGEPVLELETEKSLVEIEATETGRLVEQLLAVDAEVHVGDRAAWLETDAAGVVSASSGAAEAPARSDTSATNGAGSSAAGQPAPARAASEAPSTTSAGAARTATPADSAQAPPTRTVRVMSSPVARRLASQNGLDLRNVRGTGPRGRIQLSDVRKAIEVKGAASAGPQRLSSMRRAVARSMTLSASTVPQFTVSQAVDWTAVQAKRAQLSSSAAKVSVNDFLLQAIARALLTYPALNSTFRGEVDSPDAAIVPAGGAHLGLVVAVENGLLVPVLHDVQQLSLGELARRRADMVDRALKGRLKQAELEGGTFSLSNLGARGPDRFTALINPPQSAILAVGRQRDRVVAIAGGIHVRPMSDLSLTVDHRVADGRLASEFLRYLVEILEGNEWRT